jgi:hypothetical protein
MKPFAVLGTPRSRTAWMARFLTYGGTYCYHEPSASFTGVESLRRFFKPGVGAVDSAMTLRWRDVAKVARIVVVERDIEEVAQSALNVGLPASSIPVLAHISKAIDEIRLAKVATIIPYDMLTDAVLRKLFEVLLGEPCPEWWLSKWKSTHVDGVNSYGRRVEQVRANSMLATFYPELMRV